MYETMDSVLARELVPWHPDMAILNPTWFGSISGIRRQLLPLKRHAGSDSLQLIWGLDTGIKSSVLFSYKDEQEPSSVVREPAP